MKFTWRLLPSALAVVLLSVGVVSLRLPATAANDAVLPDLQTLIPRDSFSIVNSAQGREFRYTHLIFNQGPGSLEVQPRYSETAGSYIGEQLTYRSSNPTSAPSTWTKGPSLRVADTFNYHAAHGHFHFPLATFGLYADVNGKIGQPVALSPKIGFCIADSYVYDRTVANSGDTVGSRGECSDPNSLRGISIGGADEYNYLDPGQAIPINGLRDGTYWFKAVSDPNNDFLETNEANNEEDVHVRITGDDVVVLDNANVRPDTTPPSGGLSAPAEGAVVTGTTKLVASAADGPSAASKISSVSFVVDGVVVGTDTSAPYTVDFDTTPLADGVHWFAARVTDAAGRTDTSDVHAATVSNPTGAGSEDLRLAAVASVDGRKSVTTNLTSLTAGDQLVALVSADGPELPGQPSERDKQTALVTASGVAWTMSKRAHDQPGTAEVWTAKVTTATAKLAVAASLVTNPDYNLSLTVLVARGAKGIGRLGAASGNSATQSVSLTSSAQGSMVYAVGSDWDHDAQRELPDTQEIVHQRLIPGSGWPGDTLWVQRSKKVTAGSEPMSMTASVPAAGRYNLAAVEIMTNSPGDRSAPRVGITDPIADPSLTLSGRTRLAATAADNVGVTKVEFLVDGAVVGTATAPPYAVVWSSRLVKNGTHALTARAYDQAGNRSDSAAVTVTVDNARRPPSRISMEAKGVGRSSGAEATSPGTMTASLGPVGAGRLLLAFVSQDGLEGGRQGSTVTSDGLTWTMINRLNRQTGAVEIWSAGTRQSQASLTVKANPLDTGYAGQLTVLAVKGASGTGVAGVTGLQRGAPSVYLPGVGAMSWVVGVGDDPDGAVTRGLPADELVAEWASPGPGIEQDTGATFWVQALPQQTSISGLVTLTTPGRTDHQWNMAAVEVRPERAPVLPVTRTPLPDQTNPGTRPPIPGHHG